MKRDVVLDEIAKDLNWKEKIIMKMFTRYTYKVYNIGITFGFNNK